MTTGKAHIGESGGSLSADIGFSSVFTLDRVPKKPSPSWLQKNLVVFPPSTSCRLRLSADTEIAGPPVESWSRKVSDTCISLSLVWLFVGLGSRCQLCLASRLASDHLGISDCWVSCGSCGTVLEPSLSLSLILSLSFSISPSLSCTSWQSSSWFSLAFCCKSFFGWFLDQTVANHSDAVK